jgi:hypothetical protein
MFSLQGGLQGGPAILTPAEQLNGHGMGEASSVLDIEPFTDKHCARLNSGSHCSATTADGVDLFKDVQVAVNKAASALRVVGKLDPYTALKIDGVIGPSTADLATAVLLAADPTTRSKVWLNDPRSMKTELMAPLLASQPQYAVETFTEIAEQARPTPVQPVSPVEPSAPVPETSPPGTVPAPAPAAEPPKVFWTRKKKIVAVAGVGVLAVGLLALVLWMRNRAE